MRGGGGHCDWCERGGYVFILGGLGIVTACFEIPVNSLCLIVHLLLL